MNLFKLYSVVGVQWNTWSKYSPMQVESMQVGMTDNKNAKLDITYKWMRGIEVDCKEA